MGNYIFVIGLLAYCKMKSKLAVFDYDSTIRDNDLDDDWQMGVGHLFPEGKVPEHLHEMRQKEGPRVFLEHVKDSINKVGVTKEQLEDGFPNKIGFLVEKMDDVIKMLHPDHDIIIITGSYRNYTDSFLKRFDLFELINDIFAIPTNITDQGKNCHMWHLLSNYSYILYKKYIL